MVASGPGLQCVHGVLGVSGAIRRQWLHLLQQCRQGSRCLHGSDNHATTVGLICCCCFKQQQKGIAHSCSLWSLAYHRFAQAAWQIFICVNHIKLAKDQLAKRGGTSYSPNSAHCPQQCPLPPTAAATATAGERGLRTRIQRVPRRRRRTASPGQALVYAAPSCRFNALWFGILSSTCSSNCANHSTATR